MRRAAGLIIFLSLGCAFSRAQNYSQIAGAAIAGVQASPLGAAQATPTATAATPQVSAPGPTSNDRAVSLARKYIEAWNSGDKAAVDSFPDFIMHNHGGRVVVGRDMLERVIANWRRSMPDLKFTIDDTIVQEDKVVLRVTLKGTYKERLFPESGDPQNPPRLVRATGLIMFKTGAEKIQEIWQELDESMLRVQMGAQWKTRQELDAGSSKSKKPETAPSSGPPKN